MVSIDIDALISKAREVFEQIEPVDQDVLLGEKVVTVRVWPMEGPDWRDLIAEHPPRVKSSTDSTAGYNVDSVAKVYPRLALVDGDTVDNLVRRDEKGREFSRWPEIAARLLGADLRNIASAVWGVNEFDPQKRMVAAGKGSTGGSRKKRSSPGN